MTIKEIVHQCKVKCLGQCKIFTLGDMGYIELPDGHIQGPIYYCPYCRKKLGYNIVTNHR